MSRKTFYQALPNFLVEKRYLLSLLIVFLTILFTAGAHKLYLNNNYQIFFDTENPQRLAHEAQQLTYVKTDNIALLINANDGPLFSEEKLNAIKDLTREGWNVPFVYRVDSITNYQYSYAEGDDIIIEDFVSDTSSLSGEELEALRKVALSEPQIFKRYISSDSQTTLINLSLELPEYPNDDSVSSERREKIEMRAGAIREASVYTRKLVSDFAEKHPSLDVYMLGEVTLNQELADVSDRDAATLIPMMFLIILVVLGVLLRSVGAVLGTMCVIIFAILAATGAVGWVGSTLNMVTVTAPIIILTLAVCDSVHVLSIYMQQLSNGDKPKEAMKRSLEINLTPVIITSVTTAVGFLTLNFASAVPFKALGNFCAFGVIYAMLVTLCILPTISILTIRKSSIGKSKLIGLVNKIGEAVIKAPRRAFFGILTFTLVAILFIPANQVNDDTALYFKIGHDYRDAIDFSQKELPGVYDINFSLNCGQAECINQVEFLKKTEAFSDWLKAQDNVEFVQTYTDVIKRINKSLNEDKLEFYALPVSDELSAQYNLFYELSLPVGLDLNYLNNYDKSATRITAYIRQTTTRDFIDFEEEAYTWLEVNHPELSARGSSIRMMFAILGEDNIRGLSWGALVALIAVSMIILFSLRSLKYTLISFLPNSLPAAIALGLWGASVGQINMGVAAVFSITLGIIVDDCVHFISKYRYAHEREGKSPEEAIRYVFSTAGPALVITTFVLTIGFLTLCFSDFALNSHLGALTALTIVVALIFDFLFFPPLLIALEKIKTRKRT